MQHGVVKQNTLTHTFTHTHTHTRTRTHTHTHTRTRTHTHTLFIARQRVLDDTLQIQDELPEPTARHSVSSNKNHSTNDILWVHIH